MLKYFYLFLIGTLLLSSCKIYSPTYKRVENFQFKKIDNNGFSLSANAIFYNPNNLKFKIDNIAMNVHLNEKKLGAINEGSSVQIQKKSEFTIPLNIVLRPEMSVLDGMKEIFNLFTNKEATIRLDGNVLVKAFGIKVPIPINEQQKVNLKNLKF